MDASPGPLLHRDASLHGLSRAQLRQRRWAHPAFGLAVPAADVADLHRLCRGMQLVLPPSAVFSHLTAAALRGWWSPNISVPLPLIATTPRGSPHLDRRGVYVRRCRVAAEHRQTVDGIRVASPEWTLVELAEDLALIDLVIMLDCALARGHVSKDSIRSALVPRRAGAPRLRRALSLADCRSESAWESALRLLHVLAGFEDVEPQYEVFDADGAFVARVDLRLGRSRRAAEYDGAGHRERDRHHDDLRREKGLARCGWERYGYTSTEICRRPALIIKDAEAAYGVPHDPERVAAWLDDFAAASISPSGRVALARRLSRFLRTASPHTARRLAKSPTPT